MNNQEVLARISEEVRKYDKEVWELEEGISDIQDILLDYDVLDEDEAYKINKTKISELLEEDVDPSEVISELTDLKKCWEEAQEEAFWIRALYEFAGDNPDSGEFQDAKERFSA